MLCQKYIRHRCRFQQIEVAEMNNEELEHAAGTRVDALRKMEDDRHNAPASLTDRFKRFVYEGDPSKREDLSQQYPSQLSTLVRSRSKRPRSSSSTSSRSLKKRTTTKQRSAKDEYFPENNLVDSLRPDLTLIFVGLNPGLDTAKTGHAYAHRSNLFWKLLHRSGLTEHQHPPSDTHKLPDLYNYGNTNLCERPTRSGDGLSKEEQDEGAAVVNDKIHKFRPRIVCIVGKGIWDVIYKVKTGRTQKKDEFRYGWQDESLWLGRNGDVDSEGGYKGAKTFVATSTSGLAASLKPAEKESIWKELGDYVKSLNAE